MMPLTGAALGAPLVCARSAEIYPWGQDEIIKLFRSGFCADTARRERLAAEEAHAQGATRIRCLGEVEIDGRIGLIMNRIDGRTLTASADANPLALIRLPRTLARLHVGVHNARTPRLDDIRRVISDQLDSPALEFLNSRDKALLQDYLSRLPDGDALLHMDFHTENILVNKEYETVIDWATAARGDVGADIAMTWFLFHEAELFPGISRFQQALYNTLRKQIYRRYLRHYIRMSGLSADDINARIRRWYLPVLVCRLALWSAPTETEPLKAGILRGIHALRHGEQTA